MEKGFPFEKKGKKPLGSQHPLARSYEKPRNPVKMKLTKGILICSRSM
jgi:hypothetical protein